MTVRWAHRIEYGLIRSGGLLLRALPEPLALLLGGCMGWLAGVVFRVRRRVVDENLARAFPSRSRRWRSRIARRSYFHLGREGVAVLRLSSMEPRTIEERTRVEGLERVRETVAEGRGLLLLTGHLGNWEIGGAALAARGIPLDVVATRQSNPLFDDLVVRARERLGMRVIVKHEANRRVLRSLREGRAVALVADQNVRRGGIFVDFFGTPAATARGPALFALRTGAPVVLGTALRLRGARAHYLVRLRLLAVEGRAEGDPKEDGTRRLTRAYAGALEEAVAERPEQYFWHHRRWKTRPEPVPAEAE